MAIIKQAVKYLIRQYSGFYVRTAEIHAKAEQLISEQSSILNKIGFVHNTDKASIWKADGYLGISHDYLRHYDYLFSQFRAEKFSLIEFGCQEGNSMRMWEQYFPNAEIFGVDIDEAAKQHEKGRVHIVIGDATSPETLAALKAQTGGSAFIILDDASHAWSDQRRSFELFWDMLTPGGFYVIEDLMCASAGAYPKYSPKILDAQPLFKYMQDRSEILLWSPSKSYAWDAVKEEDTPRFKYLPEHIQKIEREMDMCIFIPGAVVVRKKP